MTVGLGIIGIGWWGGVLAKAAKASKQAQVVACYARTEERRDSFAEEHNCASSSSIDALLSNPDVEGVVIATSHSSHLPYIQAAVDAGKPVFVEKPLTLTSDESRKVIEIAGSAGVPLQVGHQRRRSAANRRIKQMIDAGDLGDIQAIETNHSVPNALNLPPQAWRRDRAESPLGGMTSLGVHKVDTMHYLVGPMKRVFVFAKNTMSEPPIDEAVVVAVEFQNGALGTLHTHFVVPVISRLSVFGTNHCAHMEADGTQLFTQEGGPERTEVPLDPVNPIEDQMAAFAAVVRGEAEPEVGPAEGAAVVAAMEAMIRSDETGMPVEVDYSWTGWA